MVLSAQMLSEMVDVNTYSVVSSVSFTEGDALNVYFRLIDQTKVDDQANPYSPKRRYVPVASPAPMLTVTLWNVQHQKQVIRVAAQPFATDGSIWMFPVLATDHFRGTPDLRLTLSEGANVTRGIVKSALRIDSKYFASSLAPEGPFEGYEWQT